MFLDALIPDGDVRYVQDYEGPDDMPAHVKSSVLGCSVSIPVKRGGCYVGTWHGILLVRTQR